MTSLPAPDDTRTLQGQQHQGASLSRKIAIRGKNTTEFLARQSSFAEDFICLHRLQGAATERFQFDTQEPIEMKFFLEEPFFKLVAARSVEFD